MGLCLVGMLLAAQLTLAARPPGPYDDLDTGEIPEDTASPASCACYNHVLRNGVQLPDQPEIYTRTNPNTAWGIPGMIRVLVETGRKMRSRVPGATPFVIGDISTRSGGHLAPHRTHQGGIDADIALYSGNAWQNSRGIIPFPQQSLDLATNWTLISTLLESGRVDMILLDPGIIIRLRTYVLTHGLLSVAMANRVIPLPGQSYDWRATGMIHPASGHDGHLHVRVLCDDDERAR